MSDETTPQPPSEPDGLDRAALIAPGLHELTASDRAATAQQLADELHGEVVASSDLAMMLRRRRAGDVAAARALLERRAAAEPDDGVREVIGIEALEGIARGLSKAERIVTGTEANMAETVGQRVSGGGISVHPESIRSAAKDVLDVRKEVAGVQAELDELNNAVMDAMIDSAPAPAAPGSGPTEPPREQGKLDRATKRRILGVILMSLGIAVGLGAVLWVAVGIPAVVVMILPIVAVWWAYDKARVDILDLDDKDVASDNLALIGARTDAVFGSVAAEESGSGIPASAGAKMQLIESRLELARERERSAVSSWAELAGTGTDPLDVDRVLRERDPQYFAAVDMVGQTSQARAASAHARRVRAKWNLAWSVLGEDPPPAGDAEQAVRDLAAGLSALHINTRVGTDADVELARETLGQLQESPPSGPLILTGLSDDLTDEVIDQLAELAISTSVVLLSEVSGSTTG